VAQFGQARAIGRQLRAAHGFVGWGDVLLAAMPILGITGLANTPVKVQYGGALGGRFGLGGVGVFLEAGLLPTNVELKDPTTGATSNKLIWIAEGRLGLRFG
jgi:hypothetical protein